MRNATANKLPGVTQRQAGFLIAGPKRYSTASMKSATTIASGMLSQRIIDADKSEAEEKVIQASRE